MRIARLTKQISRLSLRRLIVIASVVLIVIALPWIDVLRIFMPESVIGLDGAFLTSLLLIPFLTGLLLYLFSNIADDRERHMRKYENE